MAEVNRRTLTDGGVLVQARGEFDLATAGKLRAALLAAVQEVAAEVHAQGAGATQPQAERQPENLGTPETDAGGDADDNQTGDNRPARVLVDLSQVTFIDSSGISALSAGYKAARQLDIEFVAINPSPSILPILTITGLTSVFVAVGPTDPAGENTGEPAAD